jgi:hypothetical protein
MNSESTQVLLYKKKVVNYCLILLIFLFAFGLLQAFEKDKLKIASFEKKSNIINII